MSTIKLGKGKVAITGGLQVPDSDTIVGLLFFEPDKGAGLIAAPTGRTKGELIWPEDVKGSILEFSNPMSIDVVIGQLATMRCEWNRALNDPEYRRELVAQSESAKREAA